MLQEPAISQPPQSRWFAVQIKPNGRLIAERNLSRQGFMVFSPFEEQDVRRGTGYRRVRKPLFPGYLFVAIPSDGDHWRSINSTLGVVRLVSLANQPARIPSAFMSELAARCDERGQLLPAGTYATGEKIRFASGPFTEFVATVETVPDQQRIWVLLDILGTQQRVRARARDFLPAEPLPSG